MVTAATVATKSASIWEVQQLGTTVLRAEPWQQDYASVSILLLPLAHHTSGSFLAHPGPWTLVLLNLFAVLWLLYQNCLSGQVSVTNTLLSYCTAVSQLQCRSCKIALARD